MSLWMRSFVEPLSSPDGRSCKRAAIVLMAIFLPVGLVSSYLTQRSEFTTWLSIAGFFVGVSLFVLAIRAPVGDGHEAYWSWFLTLVGVAQILGFAQLRDASSVMLPVLYVLPFFGALYLSMGGFHHSLRVTAGVFVVVLALNLERPWIVMTIAITLVSALSASFLTHQVVLALRRSNRELDEARGLAESLATTDVLTGAPNRRAVAARVAGGAGAGSVVLLVDADRFKAINDHYGHAHGDAVLRTLYRRLCDQVPGVWVARWGGEEFLVLSQDDPAVDAAVLAESVRWAVASAPLSTSGGTVPETVSVGGAAWGSDEPFETAVGRADAALYQAKAAGRDRAVAAPVAAGAVGDGSGAMVARPGVASTSSRGVPRPT